MDMRLANGSPIAPIDGGAELNAMADAATASVAFPTADAAMRFRNCAVLSLENCVTDSEAPTVRGGIRMRDALLVGGGLLGGWLVCKQMG